jgi:hypothetical protein
MKGAIEPGRTREISALVKAGPLYGWVKSMPCPKVETALGVPKSGDAARTG